MLKKKKREIEPIKSMLKNTNLHKTVLGSLLRQVFSQIGPQMLHGAGRRPF